MNDKYYLLREDGSAVFFLPYDKDFLVSCLISLENRGFDTRGYRLASVDCSCFRLSLCPPPSLISIANREEASKW